jgi:hypothetical protein
MTRRVQQRRTRGWRKADGAVSVARPHRWGNPHDWRIIGYTEAVARYRDDLYAGRLPYTVDDVRAELAGHDLMCFCPPDGPCHADVLLEAAR